MARIPMSEVVGFCEDEVEDVERLLIGVGCDGTVGVVVNERVYRVEMGMALEVIEGLMGLVFGEANGEWRMVNGEW